MATETLPIQQVRPLTKKRSRKPAAFKSAIVARIAAGHTKTRIAKDLGIARNTVRAIADETNIERELEAYRPDAVKLIPKAFQALEKSLDRGDGALGIRYLEDMAVIGERAHKTSNAASQMSAIFQQCQVLIQQAPAVAQPSNEQSNVDAQVNTSTTQAIDIKTVLSTKQD
jgi:DNA-binding XRE family transcriptional regulator